MEVTEAQLRNRYESLETEELITLTKQGQLTDLAQKVISEVLISRGAEKQDTTADLPIDQETAPIEIIPTAISLPYLWPGFVVSGAFLLGEMVITAKSPYQNVSLGLVFISLISGVYWLFSVYRLHRLMREATNGRYPVSPAEAVGFHLIPLFNLFWIYYWPRKMAVFFSQNTDRDVLDKNWPGILLLLGSLCSMFLDRAVGLALGFLVLLYIFRQTRIAVKLFAVDR